jgi:hypothetical protein
MRHHKYRLRLHFCNKTCRVPPFWPPSLTDYFPGEVSSIAVGAFSALLLLRLALQLVGDSGEQLFGWKGF